MVIYTDQEQDGNLKELLFNFFRQGMRYQQDWNNEQIGEVEEITEMDFYEYYKNTTNDGRLTFLLPIIEDYKDGSNETLGGDEVDRLCEI